jgi:hypothetical protein
MGGGGRGGDIGKKNARDEIGRKELGGIMSKEKEKEEYTMSQKIPQIS